MKIKYVIIVFIVGFAAGWFLHKREITLIRESRPIQVTIDPEIDVREFTRIEPLSERKIIPVYDTVPIYDTISVVDTTAILQDYFTERSYHDTLKNDTAALIILDEKIALNRIQWRKMYYQNRIPTKIYLPASGPDIYFGASVYVGRGTAGAGPSVSYQKDKTLFSASIYHNGLFTLSYSWKF